MADRDRTTTNVVTVDRSEDYDGRRPPPTRRPLTRPQSARMNRYVHNVQYKNALRQIAADQEASLDQAQCYRELARDAAQQALRRQNDLKILHTEAIKEKQQRHATKRANEYFSADMQRTKDWHAKTRAKYEEFMEAQVAKADDREYQAEMKRQQIRHSERIWAMLERERSAQSQFEASQQRMELMESKREQMEQARRKKEEMRDRCYAFQNRQKEQRYADSVSKEIQRTQGRMLQLQCDKYAWQAACEDREISLAEHLIDDKIQGETARLDCLKSELHVAAMQPKRQRPRSAIMTRPRTGGISVFSSDTPRTVASIFTDATKLGPCVSVVDARISVA